MTEKLQINELFEESDGVFHFTEKGLEALAILMDEYSGDDIRKISGITRNALANYKRTPDCRVSKRGKQGIEKLIHFFNDDERQPGDDTMEAPSELSRYSERELMLELKRRGLKVTITI